jgi:hypothetical protein
MFSVRLVQTKLICVLLCVETFKKIPCMVKQPTHWCTYQWIPSTKNPWAAARITAPLLSPGSAFHSVQCFLEKVHHMGCVLSCTMTCAMSMLGTFLLILSQTCHCAHSPMKTLHTKEMNGSLSILFRRILHLGHWNIMPHTLLLTVTWLLCFTSCFWLVAYYGHSHMFNFHWPCSVAVLWRGLISTALVHMKMHIQGLYLFIVESCGPKN